jgi:hypothetical protein
MMDWWAWFIAGYFIGVVCTSLLFMFYVGANIWRG